MNFVLAAVIFALVFMIVGRPALPAVVGWVAPDGAPPRGRGSRPATASARSTASPCSTGTR